MNDDRGFSLEEYDFHDVSESIPEDDEDYSSTDCTYYSEELEAIYKSPKPVVAVAAESNKNADRNNFSDDDDFFDGQSKETSNSFRTRGSSVLDTSELGGSYKTRGSSILDANSNNSSSHRSNSSRVDPNDRDDDEDSSDGGEDEYSSDEDSYQSINQEAASGGSVQLTSSFSFRSLIENNSKSSNSSSSDGDSSHGKQQQVVSDDDESDHASFSSSSEENVSLSGHDDRQLFSTTNHSQSNNDSSKNSFELSGHNKASVHSSKNSFEFSAEWASFGNLNERQPTIIEANQNDNSANPFDAADFGDDRDDGDDPFGGDDPFSTNQHDNNNNNYDHSEVSGTDNTDVCGIYPFATFNSSAGNFSGQLPKAEESDESDNEEDPNSRFWGNDKGDDPFANFAPTNEDNPANNSDKSKSDNDDDSASSESSSRNVEEQQPLEQQQSDFGWDDGNEYQEESYREETYHSSSDEGESRSSHREEEKKPGSSPQQYSEGEEDSSQEREDSENSNDEEEYSSSHDSSSDSSNVEEPPSHGSQQSWQEQVNFGDSRTGFTTASSDLEENGSASSSSEENYEDSNNEELFHASFSNVNNNSNNSNNSNNNNNNNNNEHSDSKNTTALTHETLNSTQSESSLDDNETNKNESNLDKKSSRNDDSEHSESSGYSEVVPLNDEPKNDESNHDENEDEVRSFLDETTSASSSGYSALRSFESDSWNSDLDPTGRSFSDSSFHDSDLSKSLRLDAQEGFIPVEPDEEYTEPLKKESTYSDRNQNSDEDSLSEEEVEASTSHVSFFDDSEYSNTGKGEATNESCSVSMSGFDSSEFSRSLRIETKEPFIPGVDNSERSPGQAPAPENNEASSSKQSSKDPDAWEAAFDTPEVTNAEPLTKAAHKPRSDSVDEGSDHDSYGEELQKEINKCDTAIASVESGYSSSSYDSHQDFRSRSQNKRPVDESFNSAFDISRSGSFDLSKRSGSFDFSRSGSFNVSRSDINGGTRPDSSEHRSKRSSNSESRGSRSHSSEDSTSKPIQEEPDQSSNDSSSVSSSSGTSGDHSKSSLPHQDPRLTISSGEKNDRSSSTKNDEFSAKVKNESVADNGKQQDEVEKVHSPNDKAPGEDSEISMKIGDVFGQPNELFERDPSSKSSSGLNGLTDYILQRKEEKDLIIVEAKNEEASKDQSKDQSENDEQKLNAKRKKGAKAVPKVVSEKERRQKKRRRKERLRRKREAKSPALLDFAANVNDAILDLEDRSESEQGTDSPAYSLLHGFDALLGIFLQLSDEVELIATFSALKTKDEGSVMHISALTAVLDFAETFNQLFSDLQPIIFDCFDEADEYVDELFDRLDALVDLVCETTNRVGERQEWSCRSETTYVTLLELIERDSLDLRCYFDDVETPDPGISANVHEAWSATGHIEELKALQRNNDPQIFRQICYEVMVSTDQWCPDRDTLMEICDIDPEIFEEENPQELISEDELAPIPQAAEHILDKVNGETLPRLDAFASVLRRILPPHAVTDPSLRRHFRSIRNSIDSPLGLSATSVVSISSVPESINDPDALGVAGVGKTTLAAMVAEHRDVRQHFIDGVAWVYLGDKELNYNRYTQCLRELVAQLDFYDGVPLFAELLHTPGENPSKRKRREEGFMIYARDTIAGLLEDRSVLIILDDVCFEPDMDWFDFAPMPDESTDSQIDSCALVITTRRRSLLPAADTVEIDMLNETDAITLLIQESGQLSRTLMAESKEARSVVRECANHPLAVKSIGRWLNLKHATSGVVSSVEEIHNEVIKSMDKILKAGDNTGTDMMYEILSTSLSPAINGGPTNIIKFCFAAFIMVFCDREHISDFELTEPTPIIPMDIAELLFQTLLEMYEVSLLKKGSLFYAQKKEAAVLIPEALSALGVLKVITYSDTEEDEFTDDEQKFLQVMHSIHHEYGVYLANDDRSLKDFTKDAERQWNRALVEAYQSRVREWDWDLDDAAHGYALEMIVSHMIRGAMFKEAATLLTERSFIRGRLKSLGRENCTKRYIKDCELLFKKLKAKERVPRGLNLQPRSVMKRAYHALGRELTINVEKKTQDARVKNVEVARSHYEIGFSLAENRCWDAAISHWETSQELLMLALGPVEVVAGISFNIGVVYSELNEYEQALACLQQCLKIRATAHGEEHVLYAQTIQKIGDVLLDMCDYHEAMESYNWALDVMYKNPDHHYIEIGEILDNKGMIHYSKGEVEEALQCHQEALRSKQEDLGEDHPELAETYHNIGNCLSDQGNIEDAIIHFEEAVRLKELDPDGGPENDAEVLTIEGILNNLEGNQKQGLECYERALQILVTKVPHQKEKIASLLHLIGCVYLMSGEQTKAMKLFKESLKARRKVLGFIHLDVASTLFNMAFLHQTRNRLDKALRCLEEALKIRQLRLPESEKVAVTHEKIGSLARGMGKAKKAQIAFEEALKIRKSIHGQQHEAVACVLQELGDLMDDLGEYESAMGFYVDALEIRRSRLGLDDIAVAETLYSMGYTLHNSDESERALACFVEALSIRRYQVGEDSMEVGDTLNMMGFLKAKRGELDDALTLLWDALRIRKLQDDHIKVSETLKNIGNVHREKQELDLALECYEESLRIRRRELGHEHEKVADVLVAMGNVYSENPLQAEEAKRAYQKAMDIRSSVFGSHDESVSVVLQYLGTIEYNSKNHDRARELLQKFVKIKRDNGTHNDGDYVNVLFMIGNIHKEQGNEAQAKEAWNEAYQVFSESGLGDTNPKIAAAMQHLVEEDKIDKHLYNKETSSQTNKTKSIFGMVSDILVKKEKSDDDSLYQNRRKSARRLKGKGFKL